MPITDWRWGQLVVCAAIEMFWRIQRVWVLKLLLVYYPVNCIVFDIVLLLQDKALTFQIK